MKLFCIIGEDSGDLHCGQVLEKLMSQMPNLKLVGTGGERFRGLAEKTFYGSDEMSVIGLWEVLKKYSYFKNLLTDLIDRAKAENPDAFLLVDYPGLNLRLAKAVKRMGKPIYYYISPQAWAWKKKRAFKMKRLLNEMIVLFPFEVDFFRNYADMDCHCFGHPFVDVASRKYAVPEEFARYEKNVVLLPGSRKNELENHLGIFLEAAKSFRQVHPSTHFYILKSKELPESCFHRYGNLDPELFSLIAVNRRNYIRHADFSWCASGTASLESAILRTPPIIVYKTSILTYVTAKHVLGINRIGLPNIVLNKDVFPEIVRDITTESLLQATQNILSDSALNDKNREIYDELIGLLGQSDSYAKTADFLKGHLVKLQL